MPYSHSLAGRVRLATRSLRGLAEKPMFGGLAFLYYGNLLVGVWQQSLIVRLGPSQATAALQRDHVRPFDGAGRPMRGWVMIDAEALESDAELARWIALATDFVATLPRK